MNTEEFSHLELTKQLQNLLLEGAISVDPFKCAASTGAGILPPLGQSPICIVHPANSDELQAVLIFANQVGLNLTVTSSTGIHRHGGIANPAENVLIDLSHWQKIYLIDRRNRVCRIEPGVTYGQLMAELAEHGMILSAPLAPRNGKSVLASIMDREPTTWPPKQWDSSDPVGSTEFFFGNGERFRSGAAGGPGTIEQQRLSGGAQKFSSGPSQSDFHRVVQGAQGTLGIVTWITLRTEIKPALQQPLLTGSDRLEELLPFVYGVQRGILGEQTLLLDRTAAAMLLSNGERHEFEKFRAGCPDFVYLQNVAGFERLPHERLAYHLQDIQLIAQKNGLRLRERVGTISSVELFARATQPCGDVDWRDQLQGRSLSIFFLTTLNRTPTFHEVFTESLQESGMTETDFGTYIQPIVQNHACHMEFIVPFAGSTEAEVDRIRRLERQAVIRLMEAGAFFSRPYGSAADLVWLQNPSNYRLVKAVKQIFDPNRVLQRGKWGL